MTETDMTDAQRLIAAVESIDQTGYNTSTNEPPTPRQRADTEKQKRTPQRTGPIGLTDAFMVDQIARDLYDNRFCWSPQFKWLHWNGRVWSRVDDATVWDATRLYLSEWALEYIKDNPSTNPTVVFSLLTKGKISALVELSRGVVLIDGDRFDADPDVLTCENGVIHLPTGELMPFDPDRYLTRYVPTAYHRTAHHVDVDAVLSAVSDETRPWLQLRLGQGITGHVPDDDVLLLMHGDGQNGKSTLIDALTVTLGGRGDDGAMTFVDDAVIAGDRGAREERMALRGARLAFAEELPEGRRLNVVALKKAIGTATMKSRHNYARESQWTTSHTLIITTNYKPLVSETDHGTWRRLALVPFPFTFTRHPTSEHERRGDAGLKNRIGRKPQREAILTWVVEGARRWYANDRTMPEHPREVQQATYEWRAESDVILRFWTDRLVPDRDSHVIATELMDEVARFLREVGQQPWSTKTIADRFGAHEITKKRRVVKARTRDQGGLSRPERPSTAWPGDDGTYALSAPPSQYNAWLGIRFATDDDQAVAACEPTPETVKTACGWWAVDGPVHGLDCAGCIAKNPAT